MQRKMQDEVRNILCEYLPLGKFILQLLLLFIIISVSTSDKYYHDDDFTKKTKLFKIVI